MSDHFHEQLFEHFLGSWNETPFVTPDLTTLS